MTLSEILTGLAAHPDASRRAAEAEPHRATGLLEVKLLPNGKVVALYHWGLREFASLDEVRLWLLGGIPTSWQE